MTELKVDQRPSGSADPRLYDPRLILGSVSAEELSGVVEPIQLLMRTYREQLPALHIPEEAASRARMIRPEDIFSLAAISPLITRVLLGEAIGRDDVAPYTDDVRSIIALPVPRKIIEEKFAGTVSGFVARPGIQRAVDTGLEAAVPFAEAIATFENPREQLRGELATFANHIYQEARRHRAEQNGTWTGDWSQINSRMDKQITADDAAHGIYDALRTVLGLTTYPEDYLPMLRRLTALTLANTHKSAAEIAERIPRALLPYVAIDVLEAMEDVQPWEQRAHNGTFVERVRVTTPRKLEAELFRVLPGVQTFAGGSKAAVAQGALRKIHETKKAVPGLLRHLPGLLPERGDEMRAILPRLRGLLLASQRPPRQR